MSQARDRAADRESAPAPDDDRPSTEDQGDDVAAIFESVAPLEQDAQAVPTPAPATLPALATGRIVRLLDRHADVQIRGRAESAVAEVDEGVDLHLLRDAQARGDLCLLEQGSDGTLYVIGIVQRRRPSQVELRGETVTIDASREVLLRAGTAALRLRQDGEVELVGSRISAASRGLFKLVGRVLRLN